MVLDHPASARPWRSTRSLLIVARSAAPVLADLPPRLRVPGSSPRSARHLVGPDALGLAEPDALIETMFGVGAFTAGLIVGLIARGYAAQPFQVKLDGVGYGFLIPIFFIATGLDFDLDALLSSASSLILVPGFAALFLLLRGLPALVLYRDDLPALERRALAPAAHLLPLVVAIIEVAVEVGRLEDRTPSRSSAPACCRCWSSR